MGANSSYGDLAVRFRAYHTNSLNVALHMVTTPVGIIAALVLLLNHPAVTEQHFQIARADHADQGLAAGGLPGGEFERQGFHVQ